MKQIQQQLPPLSLEQLVRFAGAVQDFNPIHYDDAFARSAGLPGVIAQGPLTFLVALDALVAANGELESGQFQVRLKAPVTPGAPLGLTCSTEGDVELTAGQTVALSGRVSGGAA
jgi:acyl dehydratase